MRSEVADRCQILPVWNRNMWENPRIPKVPPQPVSRPLEHLGLKAICFHLKWDFVETVVLLKVFVNLKEAVAEIFVRMQVECDLQNHKRGFVNSGFPCHFDHGIDDLQRWNSPKEIGGLCTKTPKEMMCHQQELERAKIVCITRLTSMKQRIVDKKYLWNTRYASLLPWML